MAEKRTCPICKNSVTVSEGGRIDEHAYGALFCEASGWNFTARTMADKESDRSKAAAWDNMYAQMKGLKFENYDVTPDELMDLLLADQAKAGY